jgi:hypothetical protein
LRLHVVAGLLVELGVEPTDHAALRATLADPQGVVGVVAEIKVVRVKSRY